MKNYVLKLLLNIFLFLLTLLVVCILQTIKNNCFDLNIPVTQIEIIFVFFSSLSIEVVNLPFDDNFCYLQDEKNAHKKNWCNIIILIISGISSCASIIVYALYGIMELYSSYWIIILFFDFISYSIINYKKFLIERRIDLAKEPN